MNGIGYPRAVAKTPDRNNILYVIRNSAEKDEYSIEKMWSFALRR